jgi:integrase
VPLGSYLIAMQHVQETQTVEKKKQPKVYNLIDRLRARGLESTADFLKRKAIKSQATAKAYASGLSYLDRFVSQDQVINAITKTKTKSRINADTIVPLIIKNKINVYDFVNRFVEYLTHDSKNAEKLSPRSVESYVRGVRSYFQSRDIEISEQKWKDKVTLPTVYNNVSEEAIDAEDIRNLLQHCTNRRLKVFLLTLASGGMRSMEAITLREKDIDFGNSLVDKNECAIVKIRKEFSKTKSERQIFISSEAARYLKAWIDYIYTDKDNKTKSARERNPDDLIFSSRAWNWTGNSKYPTGLYDSLLEEFQKLLAEVGLSDRKEDGVYRRRKITFHSFRRFVRTTIGNQTGDGGFGEYILGHAKNPYYTDKLEKLKTIYQDKCMSYFTFLDYPTLQAESRSLEDQLKQKDKEIELLKQRNSTTTETVASLSDAIIQLKQEVEQIKKNNKR